MTNEEKVKAKYPDATVVHNKRLSVFTVYSRRYFLMNQRDMGYVSMFQSPLPDSEQAAWADAAARIEASHE